MITFGSYFSGGGIFEAGLKGIVEPVFAVEYSAPIAEVYYNNYGLQPIVSRVQDVEVKKLPSVDWFHASPECKEFSSGNTDRVEGPEQLSQLDACLTYIKNHRPKFITFENVRGWLNSLSFTNLLVTLNQLGYTYKYKVINSADYGVPQTRDRLILIGSLIGNASLPVSTHHKNATIQTIFGETTYTWVTWYKAVEDLIPTFPESKFTDWQLKRLPPAVTVNLLIDCKNRFGDLATKRYRTDLEPSMTVTAGYTGGAIPKAFLVHENSRSSINTQDEPSNTIVTKSSVKALLETKIVKLTPRALARFQSIPDWYVLPDRETLACKIIGNGVPSLVGKAIAKEIIYLNSKAIMTA